MVGPIIIADLPRKNFQKNLKRRATAQELHLWATRVLAPYQSDPDPALWIEITNLPAAFRRLDRGAPRAYVYGDSQLRFNSKEPIAYLKVIYGSAEGHFGVILGPTNLPTPATREYVISTWAPGAWFFDGQ
jgi:hypothetical protein